MPVTLILLSLLAGADSPTDAADKPKAEATQNYYAETAARYEFYRDAKKQERLTLVTTPVFKWATDDDWSGDVFVWTYAQRPEMIGCILSGPKDKKSRDSYQEFHLLGERPVSNADMLGRFRWTPAEGLKLRSVEGAPPPAETAPLRLAQMRQILRDFTASMQANGEWELRLLPQPLLRYQSTDDVVVDGALFTFIWPKGTDPELILLLECRKTQNGNEWFYAPVRFSTRELWLKYREKEVWRGPSLVHENNSNPLKSYVSAAIETVPASRVENKPAAPTKEQ